MKSLVLCNIVGSGEFLRHPFMSIWPETEFSSFTAGHWTCCQKIDGELWTFDDGKVYKAGEEADPPKDRCTCMVLLKKLPPEPRA